MRLSVIATGILTVEVAVQELVIAESHRLESARPRQESRATLRAGGLEFASDATGERGHEGIAIRLQSPHARLVIATQHVRRADLGKEREARVDIGIHVVALVRRGAQGVRVAKVAEVNHAMRTIVSQNFTSARRATGSRCRP